MRNTVKLTCAVALLCWLMACLTLPVSAREISRNIDLRSIQDHLRFFSSLESRVSGYPGADQAAYYIRDTFRSSGLRDVMFQEFEVLVPVTHSAELTLPETGERLKIYPLWPNSVRVSSLPDEGLAGELVYVGYGEIEDFDGVDVKDSIVLMEFNSGTNWIHAANLGASAIVFIESKDATRSEAEQKLLSTPVQIPRFWLPRADAEWLVQQRLGMTMLDDSMRFGRDDPLIISFLLDKGKTIPVVVHADVRWERRVAKNVLGYVEGVDPELKKEIVVIHANYDSMSIVPDLAPGAEQAVGISVLLEMAKAYELYPPKRSVLFLATAGHGQAMAGIRSFVDYQLSLEERRLDVENPLDFLNQRVADTFFISLDLTSTDRLSSIWYSGRMYGSYGDQEGAFSKTLSVFAGLAEQAADDLRILLRDYYTETAQSPPPSPDPLTMGAPGMPGIHEESEETEPAKDTRIPLASEVFTLGGGTGVSFVTPTDARMYIDTPHDTLPKVDARNVHLKAGFLASVIWRFIDLPSGRDFPEPARLGKAFWHLAGTVYTVKPELSLQSTSPTEGALVVVRNGFTTQAGVRGDFLAWTDEEGRFHVPGIQSIGAVPDRRFMVEGYLLDWKSGELLYASNLSRESTTGKTELYFVSDRFMKNVDLTLFPCKTMVLFDVFNEPISGDFAVTVHDARTLYVMPEFGYSLPDNPAVERAFPVFLPLDSQVKLAFGPAGGKPVGMLTNASVDNPDGKGYAVVNDTILSMTWYHVLNDMWWLNESRIRTMRDNGVEQNHKIRQVHSLGKAYMEYIDAALNKLEYASALQELETARELILEVYPFMRDTVTDVVKGFLFYLVLLFPFTFVAERLLFNFNDFGKRVAGVVSIFVVVVLLLRFVHPAFGLTHNPWILILGFLFLMLLIFAVITIFHGYLKTVSRRKRRPGTLVNADLNRSAAFAMAFSLGVVNMRRRRLRTMLTSSTLILLMFLLMSFTSVMPHMSYSKSYVANTASYDGLLIRGKEFEEIPEVVVDTIVTELGHEHLVAARSWYTPPRRIDLTANGKTYQIKGVMGLQPEEIEITQIKDALIAGRWFDHGDVEENPDKSFAFDRLVSLGLKEEFIRGKVAVISSDLATLFEIGPEDVGKTFLTLNIPSEERDEFGRLKIRTFDLLIIGIFDSYEYGKVRDIDSSLLTPMDYQRVTGQGGSQQPEDTIIVPFETALDLGGAIRAVAVRPLEDVEFLPLLNRVLATVSYPVYVAEDSIIYSYTPGGILNIQRRSELAIPVLIVSLIVLNVMLGAVYERSQEISIYTALGLSPTHIGGLFLAESCAYAVLGGLSGYVIGQLLAKAIVYFNLFQGLSLNYSSMAAIGPLAVVMGIVILSTLYPARIASSSSAPTIERKWKRPTFSHDEAEVEMPFVLAREESLALCVFMKEFLEKYEVTDVGDFVTRNIELSKEAAEHGSMLIVRCDAHLAPYDLGVNQTAEVRLIPEIGAGKYRVVLYLKRLTGDLPSWQRNSYPFIGAIRRQFLLWRTVSVADKRELEKEGKRLLGEGGEERESVKGEPVVATDKSVLIRLLDNISIRIRKDYDEIIGIDQVSCGELPLRNPKKPIRPFFESARGIRYTGWRYVGLDRQGESVVLHTKLIGKKSLYERRLDPLQSPLLPEDSFSFEDEEKVYIDDLDIVFIPYRLQVADETYVGFGYQYKLTCSDRDTMVDTFYEASTWELGGMADGKTLILPGCFNEPEFVVAADSSFSTGNSVTIDMFGQFLPRFAVLECFDFQYGEVGALLTFYDEPQMILSNVRKLKDSRCIEFYDKIQFKSSNRVETPMKYVLVSQTRYARSSGRNQWTACRDVIYNRHHAKFEMMQEEPVPAIRYDILEKGTGFEQIAGSLLLFKEWGFSRINLGPIWRSDYTEKCGVIQESGGLGSPYAIWDLEVADGLGGDEGLKQLCAEAAKEKIAIMAWISPALSRLSPLFQKHPEWTVVHVDGWAYKGHYLDVIGLNMSTGASDYLYGKVERLAKSIGLGGLIVGRYPIFGVMPVNYGEKEVVPQFPDILNTLAKVQRLVITATDGHSPFGLSSWTLRQSLKSLRGMEFAFYNASFEVNIDVFNKGELDVEQYFRILANKVALTFVWSGDKSLDEYLPPEVKMINRGFEQIQKMMQIRILLPEERGVEWKNRDNEDSIICAFEEFDCQVDISREVVDLITGDKVELDEYGGFRTKPMHIYRTVELFGGEGFRAKVWVSKDGVDLIKQVREVAVRIVERLEEEAVIVLVTYGDIGDFVRWLFKLGGHAEILEPEELREQVKEFGKTLTSIYEVKEGRFI